MDYLCPCIAELKCKDYQVYQAYQAGITSYLRHEYGWWASVLCRDPKVVFFALLSDGLAGRAATVKKVRSPFHLRKKHREMVQTKGIRVASQMRVFLRWFWLQENLVLSPSPMDRLLSKCQQILLRPAYHQAVAASPILHRLFLQQWDYAQALYVTKSSDFTEAGNPISQLLGAMMISCTSGDGPTQPLQRIGYRLGYMLFLMTSVSSYPSDAKRGRYNIYLRRGMSYDAAVENAQRQCYQAAAEVAQLYHGLIFLMHRDLIQNILIYGVEQSILQMGSPQEEKL